MADMKTMLVGLALMGAAESMAAQIDPITTRWTFGAHEPYAMYRRVGRKSTGGIEGTAKWVKPWLDWWDASAPARMAELGLNGLHSRFYKGMGWEEEKKDFPNVRKFVANCHRHGVTALAYVQFATLYYEVMEKEIPDLESWAAVDEHGEKYMYQTQYNRWLPCINNEAWRQYIEKILTIALTEGGFDGVMFDNCFSYACYCPRCEKAFRAHIQSLPDREARFGFSSLPGVRIPRVRATGKGPQDVRDPLQQEWCLWRVKMLSDTVKRFCRHIKALKPDAIVSANSGSFRSGHGYSQLSVDVIDTADGGLDFLMMQTGNFPAIAKSGAIINRVRDLKIAQTIHKPICALCDADAGAQELDESSYLRPLIEDLVWGGVPTDRTVMAPVRRPGFIDEGRFALRKRVLTHFNAFAQTNRALFEAKSHAPVRLLYAVEPMGLAPSLNMSLVAVEEILLRRHVPFGHLIARGAAAPEIPDDCKVLVLANAKWLSDAQVAGVAAFAQRGGRVVITGESGLWDERGSQRFENPLEPLAKLPNVTWRTAADQPGTAQMGWTQSILPPKDHGAALLAAFAKVGYRPRVTFENLPEEVFLEVKELADGYVLHLVNYNPDQPVRTARIVLPPELSATACVPFGPNPATAQVAANGQLPPFAQYLMIRVRTNAR